MLKFLLGAQRNCIQIKKIWLKPQTHWKYLIVLKFWKTFHQSYGDNFFTFWRMQKKLLLMFFLLWECKIMFSFYHKKLKEIQWCANKCKGSKGLRKTFIEKMADLLLMLALTLIASHCSLKLSLLTPQPLKEIKIRPLRNEIKSSGDAWKLKACKIKQSKLNFWLQVWRNTQIRQD